MQTRTQTSDKAHWKMDSEIKVDHPVAHGPCLWSTSASMNNPYHVSIHLAISMSQTWITCKWMASLRLAIHLSMVHVHGPCLCLWKIANNRIYKCPSSFHGAMENWIDTCIFMSGFYRHRWGEQTWPHADKCMAMCIHVLVDVCTLVCEKSLI